MCTSKPKTPAAIPLPPQVGAETIDDAAVMARDRERRRNVQRSGRASTVIAGNTGAPATMPVKTALGS